MGKLLQYLLILSSLSIGMAQTQQSTGIDSSARRESGKALLFSLIPGGGQIYNKRPVKAVLFAGIFAYYSYEYILAQKDYEGDLKSQTLHRERNDKIWLMALTWTLNMLDSYVDSQLWDFEKYEINEDGLPETQVIKPKETEKPNDTD